MPSGEPQEGQVSEVIGDPQAPSLVESNLFISKDKYRMHNPSISFTL
jgi:hypothetical protein